MPSCRLRIKAVPGAARTQVMGRLGDAMKVRVAAAPEDGAANRELTQFVASTLGLAKSAVTLAAGPASRDKVLVIEGLELPEVEARLLQGFKP